MYLSKDVKSHLEACVCRKQMNKQVFYVCVILHVGDLVLVSILSEWKASTCNHWHRINKSISVNTPTDHNR